jgi:hypothetical protein
MSTYRVVGGLWVRLGKIKCAAKALACVSACSSFYFAKGWHFVCRFTVRLLLVVWFLGLQLTVFGFAKAVILPNKYLRSTNV